MKLHFLGANRQVTGSRYMLEVGDKQVMIDCGMFQERPFQARNWDLCPIPAEDIDALLLTHVHIDHCGLLPRLVKEGFNGPIHLTEPSAALAEIMLRDSAKIQEEDAAYKAKRHRREGRTLAHKEEPLYTDADVDYVLPLLKPNGYRERVVVNEHVTAIFHDAGHILGSAMIEVEAKENGRTVRIIFSGDIGQSDKPLISDPTLLSRADYVVMESTYGDRDHDKAVDVETQLARIINETVKRGGHVVIPTFATERAQELMYFFGKLVHAKRIPSLPVYLDSPMAVDVSGIFLKFESYLDDETKAMIHANTPPLRFPGLTMVRTASDSIRINSVDCPCVIMASSGMCNAGRIKHHLRNNIERPNSTILFVGHQGDGTLGRQILDGKPIVRIHGRDYQVRAKIEQIYGFSGHADKSGLLRWISHFQPAPQRVFLTHGEEPVSLGFADLIRKTLKLPVHVPQYRETQDL